MPGGRGAMGSSSVDAESPQTLPWLIRLDKYVDGQTYDGRSDLVVRSNNSETSLNEAVALALLNEAGVPAQKSAFVRFAVNGSEPALRLVVDLPDDDLWNADEFTGSGATYKAKSDGDYSYLGEDEEAYADAFEQKFGEDDMASLIRFLDFINNSTGEEFDADLGDYLEVDESAKYLAMQDLIGNDDDIDGPGNNSYLHYDPETGKMIVVAWDHNLAFGGLGGGGMRGARPEGGGDGERQLGDMPELPEGMAEPPGGLPERPEGMPELPEGMPELPEGMTERAEDMPDRGPGGDMPAGVSMGGNVLAQRFLASEKFAALVQNRAEGLYSTLIDSGLADDIVTRYTDLLLSQAEDLVEEESVVSESSSIIAYLRSEE